MTNHNVCTSVNEETGIWGQAHMIMWASYSYFNIMICNKFLSFVLFEENNW